MTGSVRNVVKALFASACLLLGCSEPSGSEAHLRVENGSTLWTVSGVYITRSFGQSGWGNNWLTADLGPDEARTFSLEPDTYNLRILSDHPYGTFEQIEIDMHGQRWVIVELTDSRIAAQ